MDEVWKILRNQLWDLFKDLAQIVLDTFVDALAGLIASPLVSLAVFFDLPNALAERIGDTPRFIIEDLFTVISSKLPRDRGLNSRVLTGAQGQLLVARVLGELISDLAQKPTRATAAAVYRMNAVSKPLRQRLELALGKWSLSYEERLVSKVLGVLTSPVKIVQWFLKWVDLAYVATMAVIGAGLGVACFFFLTSSEGKQVIKDFCLQQKNKSYGVYLTGADGRQVMIEGPECLEKYEGRGAYPFFMAVRKRERKAA